MTPTEAGLGYSERAERAVEEADEAELCARRRHWTKGPSPNLRRGDLWHGIHLIPLRPQSLARNPDLDLEVVLDDRQIDLVQEVSTLDCGWANS